MFLDKVVNFKDFSKPNKEIKYFSRTLTEFKTFSRLYEPWMCNEKKSKWEKNSNGRVMNKDDDHLLQFIETVDLVHK